MPSVIKGLWSDLLTSRKAGFRRLRVDVGQTGFFEGREFRMSRYIDGSAVIKVVVAVDTILQVQALTGESGTIEFKAYRADQGVEGGTFVTSDNDPEMIVLPNNNMSTAPNYVGVNQFLSGGTFTPSVNEKPTDRFKVVAATATAQRSSVGGSAARERGIGAGTYYLVFSGGGVAQYNLVYEERP